MTWLKFVAVKSFKLFIISFTQTRKNFMAWLKFVAEKSIFTHTRKNVMAWLKCVAETCLKTYLSTFTYIRVKTLWHGI